MGSGFSATPLAAASSKRLLSLPAEAFDDHDEVASRKAGFSPATCDPGPDVLAAVDNWLSDAASPGVISPSAAASATTDAPKSHPGPRQPVMLQRKPRAEGGYRRGAVPCLGDGLPAVHRKFALTVGHGQSI